MYEFCTRCSVADHYLFFLPVTSTTNLRQQARTPPPRRGAKKMSQDESGTRAKHLLLQLQAQRARWLSSAAAGVPYIKFALRMLQVCTVN